MAEAIDLNDRVIRLGMCAMRKLVSEFTKGGQKTGVGLAAILTASEASMLSIFSHGFNPDGRPKSGFSKVDLTIQITGGFDIRLAPAGFEQFGLHTIADKAVKFRLKSHGNFVVLLFDVWIDQCDEQAWNHWKLCGSAPGVCRILPNDARQLGMFEEDLANAVEPDEPTAEQPESNEPTAEDDPLNPSRDALEAFLRNLKVQMESSNGVGEEEAGHDEAEGEDDNEEPEEGSDQA